MKGIREVKVSRSNPIAVENSIPSFNLTRVETCESHVAVWNGLGRLVIRPHLGAFFCKIPFVVWC